MAAIRNNAERNPRGDFDGTTESFIVAASLKMANTWQKFVVLRAGKLQGVRGPGLFVIIPVIDSIVAVIDPGQKFRIERE